MFLPLSATLDQASINTYTCIVESALKPVRWVGSSKRDLEAFPRPVQREVGQALYAAQCGEEYPSVKALKGFATLPKEIELVKQRLAAAERNYRERHN